MTDRRRRDMPTGLSALLAVLLAIAAAAAAGAATVPWHQSFEAAQAAARAAGKPILVFVHMGAMERRGATDRGLDAYEQMATVTFADSSVLAAMAEFECFELDLRDRANDGLRDRLKVSPVVDSAGEAAAVTGIYPIMLFLDSSGVEHFRVYGYMPPLACVLHLQNARELIDSLAAVAEQPGNAAAHRNLGRIYMEMYTEDGDKFYLAAIEHLEKAIELDPNNETGASYNARVDLCIFRLPDDPQKAFAELFQLQTEDPERARRFEIQYYMAVAQYASGNVPAALELLQSFETADQNSPYYDNKWTALALALLGHIRSEQ